MKIFYAVQATGNGHISRAMTLLPYLLAHGSVDIFLSGDNAHLNLDAPVRYRSRGISLYYTCNGNLDYWQTFRRIRPLQVQREIRDLPVDQYDLVINDFEYITSAACARKKVPSVHFGHQASFQSPQAPRPATRNLAGEWLLKHYVKATHHIGLHFREYDRHILPAVVKKEIVDATPTDRGHITVYLPSYCEAQLREALSTLKDFRFEIFSRESAVIRTEGHLRFLPIDKALFNESLVHCHGIVCGAGFETPAEAMHLGKKLMVIPIRGQYEQQCNAAALEQLGVISLNKLDASFPAHFLHWVNRPSPLRQDYTYSAERCMETLFRFAEGKPASHAA